MLPFSIKRLRLVEPRYVDDDHGHAMFVTEQATVAASKIPAGTVLLEEAPIAVEQQLMNREEGVEACPHCLAFLNAAQAEVSRLQALLEHHAAPLPKARVEEVVAAMSALVGRAERTIRIRQGAPFPFPWFVGAANNNESGSSGAGQRCPACARSVGDRRVVYYTDGVVPTEADVDTEDVAAVLTRQLLEDADRYDERIRMILRLAVQYWHQGGEEEQHDNEVCRTAAVASRLEALAASLAQGNTLSLKPLQREVIRTTASRLTQIFRARCGCAACTSTAGVEGAAVISAQVIFQLRCALDANLHTCIVVNPLWSYLHHEFARLAGSSSACDDTATSERAQLETAQVAFEVLEPESVHAMGFGLYHLGSKFNHSCQPNAAFVPTEAPVRARVVALEAIDGGGTEAATEVRISYIKTSEGKADRRKALQHYGFDCDCPRCAAEQEKEGHVA